ncbi:MAG: protein arginine kinase [Clostridiales bacterium]|jgi:protein arginine kinase|nr:protein arginine kinase [Clostridiales bacterium]
MKWYIDSGKEGDVVISSRVRLARNLKGYPFTHNLSDGALSEVLQKCREAARPLGLQYLSVDAMPPINRQILMERHIISPQMLTAVRKRAVLLSEDEQISILLGEEDHIRIQCMTAGFDLEKALELANKADDALEESLDYGFSAQYGYATCCPTNTGTGMRASCMLHLPALTANGYIDTLLSAVGKVGLTVRGLYGEGTKAKGCMYQISNQITLGMSEEESLKRLSELVKMVIDKERRTREGIKRERGDKLTDLVRRAYGILQSAYLMTSDEAYKLLSDARLGVATGILQGLPLEAVNELTITTGPAHVAEAHGDVTAEHRDKLRAEIIRKKIAASGDSR